MTTRTILAAVAPYEERAREAAVSALLRLMELVLHSRAFVHMILVLHLTWLAERLSGPGDAFELDPRQYAWFIGRGGAAAWLHVFAVGALLGVLGLVIGRRWSRVAAATAMGTVEFVVARGLTSSGAAPTAEPTYGVLVILAGWLILMQWMPTPAERRLR